MTKRLNKAQRAELIELLSEINSGNLIGLSSVPELFRDWPIWSAGENMPGYMPDSPYCLFHTERAARGHCRALEREPGGSAYVSDMMPCTLREVLGQ
jgi:hypothetical protein